MDISEYSDEEIFSEAAKRASAYAKNARLDVIAYLWDEVAEQNTNAVNKIKRVEGLVPN